MFKNYMEKYMAKFRKTKVYGVTDCKKKINKDIVEKIGRASCRERVSSPV